jgi:hypothetical protein
MRKRDGVVGMRLVRVIKRCRALVESELTSEWGEMILEGIRQRKRSKREEEREGREEEREEEEREVQQRRE